MNPGDVGPYRLAPGQSTGGEMALPAGMMLSLRCDAHARCAGRMDALVLLLPEL